MIRRIVRILPEKSQSVVLQSIIARRWALTSAARLATQNVPRTPSGKNPYTVLDVDLYPSTNLSTISSLYKTKAVEAHPDREGGSNEQMAELNTAYNLIKEHHAKVIAQFSIDRETAKRRQGLAGGKGPYAKRAGGKDDQSYQITQQRRTSLHSGLTGISDVPEDSDFVEALDHTTTIEELERLWKSFATATNRIVMRLDARYITLVEHALRFELFASALEMGVRERSLRKDFADDTKQMATEFHNKAVSLGAQRELTREMKRFHREVRRELLESYVTGMESLLQAQARLWILRSIKLVTGTLAICFVLAWWMKSSFYNSLAIRFYPAIFGR